MDSGLLLAGYRLLRPWKVPESLHWGLLPPYVLTGSDHLVDAVPDDDTWFASKESARAACALTALTDVQVLALGIEETDAAVVIRQRLALDTDQLNLNEHSRQPFPD